MTTHHILTEPSLSPHDRKGREGKGREASSKTKCLRNWFARASSAFGDWSWLEAWSE